MAAGDKYTESYGIAQAASAGGLVIKMERLIAQCEKHGGDIEPLGGPIVSRGKWYQAYTQTGTYTGVKGIGL